MANQSKIFKVPANLKAIALPTEHGGWGFLVEPQLLGLLLAPSWKGLSFAMAMLALFLLHQPLKIAVKDRLKGIRTNRSLWAEGIALVYGLVAIVFLLPLLWTGTADFYLLLGMMFPFILVQAVYDFRSKSRELLPELSGAIALALSASAIVSLANWELLPALALWALLIARTVPAILFVRALLRKQKAKETNFLIVYIAHTAAFLVCLGLALANMLPYLTVLVMLILATRAYSSLNHPQAIAAKIIGFREIGFGLIMVGLTALGYWWGV
jgi:hypothetical protein